MMREPSADEPVYQALEIQDVVTAAQQGAGLAFDEIVRRYQPRVYRTAYGVVRNADDADDVVQEVFVNVWKHLGKFRHDATFSTWITRVAINTSLMHLRKVKRSRCISFDALETPEVTFSGKFESLAPSAEKVLMEEQRRTLLLRALAKLPASLREITAERLDTECSVVEIASRRGITVAAAKSRLLRARIELAAQMKPHAPLTM